LTVEYETCRHNDTGKLAFSGQAKVPVLIDHGTIVSDSWKIACFLDDKYPDRKPLMAGEQARALTKFVNLWADTVLDPPLLRTLLLHICENLHPEVDKEHYRKTREARFGVTLEELNADLEANIREFRRSLGPIREILRLQHWISGTSPGYADYIVFGEFQFARCLTRIDLLEENDPVHEWRQRMIGLYDGLANSAPVFDD
jgi:glutathione S-transferase